MIIQGLWEYKSPLLQLPHLNEDHLKYFVNKKRYIKSVQQFAKLSSEESRSLLRDLTPLEYENVIKVLGRMPLIDFNIRCEVVDDENSNVVTAGAIVTVTVNLVRRNMKELFGDSAAVEKQTIKEDDTEKLLEENGTTEVGEKENAETKVKKPVWLKQKGHKGKSKSKTSKSKPAIGVMKQAGPTTDKTNVKEISKENQAKPINVKEGNDSDADESSAESDNENVEEVERSSEDERKASSPEDDDMEWEKYVTTQDHLK